MEITDKIDIDNLLTEKTKELYNELIKKYSFDILRITNPITENEIWKCNIVDNEVSIKTEDKNDNKEYFAHELLHVLLDSKGFVDNKIIYNNLVNNSEGRIQYILRSNEIGHINNILAHHKMMPYFLNYNFDKSRFIADFENKIQIEPILDCIQSEIHKKGIPNVGMTSFLCYYFALKFPSNEQFTNDYNRYLLQFSEIHNKLFLLCESIAEKWNNSNDLSTNYNIFEELINGVEIFLK